MDFQLPEAERAMKLHVCTETDAKVKVVCGYKRSVMFR
jgi:hypothetical protein